MTSKEGRDNGAHAALSVVHAVAAAALAYWLAIDRHT